MIDFVPLKNTHRNSSAHSNKYGKTMSGPTDKIVLIHKPPSFYSWSFFYFLPENKTPSKNSD